MLSRRLLTSGNGELAYEIAYFGGGRGASIDTIETVAGVRPQAGDVLLMFVSSREQNHAPTGDNPSILLRRDTWDYGAPWETEIWGCVVEDGQTSFEFSRGGYTTDDYYFTFLKRTSGPKPDQLNALATGGGYYADFTLTNNVDEFRIHAIVAYNRNGSGYKAYDHPPYTSNERITDLNLIRSGETGYVACGVFIDDGLGRSYYNQDGSFLLSAAILNLRLNGVPLT